MGNNILAVSISHVGNNNGAVQLVPNYVYSAVDGWLDGWRCGDQEKGVAIYFTSCLVPVNIPRNVTKVSQEMSNTSHGNK